MQTLTSGTRWGEYYIVRLVAKGGMGEVYEARDTRLDRRVALKVISKEADIYEGGDLVKRFLKEARLHAKINHPNVATIHSVENIAGVETIVMEFVEGVSLSEYLKGGALTLEETLHVFEQIAGGVKCLHENKIIHRDLKPGNIHLRPDGQVKILDFGIAHTTERSNETSTGFIVGTPNYMAPELHLGETASNRSDIWSLGAIFFECLSAKRIAREYKNLLYPQGLKDIPEGVRKMLLRMVAENPNDRFSSVDEVVAEVQALKSRLAPNAMPTAVRNLTAKIRSLVDVNRPTWQPTGRPTESWNMPEKALYSATTVRATKAEPLAQQVELKATPHELPTVVAPPPRAQLPPPPPPPTKKRSRRGRKRVGKSSPAWLPGYRTAGIVLAVVTLAIVFSSSIKSWLYGSTASEPVDEPVTTIVIDPTASATPAPVATSVPNAQPAQEALSLLEPADSEWLMLEHGKNPVFTWSRPVDGGGTRLQVAADGEFMKKLVDEPVVGISFVPSIRLPEGKLFWRLIGSTSAGPRSVKLSRVEPVQLVHPVQEFAATAKDSAGVAMDFEWTCKPLVDRYLWQVATDAGFNKVVRNQVVAGCKLSHELIAPGQYFWRVRSETDRGTLALWTASSAFAVRKQALVKKVEHSRPTVAARLPEKRAPKGKVAQAPLAAAKTTLPMAATVEIKKPDAPKSSSKIARRPRDVAAADSLEAPVPLSPETGASAPSRNGKISVEFSWGVIPSADSYTLEISMEADFSKLFKTVTVPTTKVLIEQAELKGRVFWRIRANSSSGNSLWSPPSHFDIIPR